MMHCLPIDKLFRIAFFLPAFLFMFLSTTHAQDNTWVEDSLGIYQDRIEAGLEAENYTEVKDLLGKLRTEASRNLDSTIINYLQRCDEQQKFEESPWLAGAHLNNLGILSFYQRDYEAAQKHWLRAREKYQSIDSIGSVLRVSMNLGIVLEKRRKYDSAIATYQRLLPLSKELELFDNLANCYENIGIAYSMKGKNSQALAYFSLSDSVLQIHPPKEKVRWYYLWQNLSQTYSNVSEYQLAMEYALKALELTRSLNNPRLEINVLRRLFNICLTLEDYEKGLSYLQVGLPIARQIKSPPDVALFHENLTDYFIRTNDYDSALFYNKLVLDYYNENNLELEIINALNQRGEIYSGLKKHELAIVTFEESLDKNARQQPEVYLNAVTNLAGLYNKTDQFGKAVTSMNELLQETDFEFDQVDLGNIHFHLSNGYRGLNEFEKALDHYVQFTTYKDSILNETNARRVTELQTRYETAEKDRKIESLAKENEIQVLRAKTRNSQLYLLVGLSGILLTVGLVFYYQTRIKTRVNRELAQKNELILSQSEERVLLLKEIHHRVKNNLQVISSLLSMQTRREKNSQVLDAVKESQSRVKTMALLHEKLYQNNSLSSINMQEYLNQLGQFLNSTFRQDKDIQIFVDAGNISLDVNTAVPIGLITNELLSNALKYAFSDQDEGEILLSLKPNGTGGYELKVQDNGKGMDQEIDFKNLSSLGLKLVHTLTRQIQGSLNIRSEQGTTFAISFNDKLVAA